MIKTNNIIKTLQNNLCIDCGVCDVSCPHGAIEMQFTETKNYRPKVIQDICTDCGICYAVCPMATKNLNNRIKDASRDGISYGLENAKGIFKGYEEKYDDYIQSSSGGILSALLKHLIETNVIDTVIHAEQLLGDSDSSYYKSSFSHTSDEIDSKRSSFYHPINFSPTLKEAIESDTINSIAVLGTPCVLSGIKQLRKFNKIIDKKIKFTFSLICSHNVSGQLTEVLKNDLKPNSTDKFTFKHRDKVGINNDSEFNNSIKNDKEYISQNRNKTSFTNNWRSFSYAHEGCLYCPDFLGADADAGFKDAWGFSVDRKEGETVFFANSDELIDTFSEMKKQSKIQYSSVEKSKLIESQKSTLIHKSYFAQYHQQKHEALNKTKPSQVKTRYSLLERFLVSLDHKIKQNNLRKSKRIFQKSSKRLSKTRLKWSSFLTRKIGVYLTLLSLPRINQAKFEVLYTAGFGYDNIGDEAQLSSNLELWKSFYPKAKLTILSPNPDYTRRVHGNYDILPAARSTFWGLHNIEYGGLSERKIFKRFFQYRFINLKIAAFCLKYFNRTIFVSPQSSFLLKRIQKANVLHIGGGGYLTGKTQSRLFDNMGLIWAANYFKLDVILSGHNIGIWQNKYHQKIAKQLKKAAFIGLRDNDASITDLKTIGIDDSKKVIPLFDDALFCSSIDQNQRLTLFKEQNISDKPYILLNLTYTKKSKKEVLGFIDQLDPILKSIQEHHDLNIIAVSMHHTDNDAINYLQSKNPNVINFDHHNDFKTVIGLIKSAHITLTLRHHPIIFSMAGCVPTISVVSDAYFLHKNIGAMKLFNQDHRVFSIDQLDDKKLLDEISNCIKNRDSISEEIKINLDKYEKKRGFIIKKYLKDYLNYKA